MTAQLSPMSVQKFFDNNGNPLAFGLLYSYVAGTVTPQATYTDSTQTVQNQNPITLNFRAEAQIWLDPTLSYKFLLTDSTGNTIPGWPIDNVPGGYVPGSQFIGTVIAGLLNPVTSVAILNSLVRTAAEIAAGVTPVNYAYGASPLDLRRYGADSTGTTFSDTAMASAIAVCGAAGLNGGRIYLAAGKYKFANPWVLTSGITIEGDGCTTGGTFPGT